MTFSSFNLPQTLLKGIGLEGFRTPTEIQGQVIPQALKGKDIVGIAKTGSGKTASYVLPILTLISQLPQKPKNRHIDGLVLVPTRELAKQVGDVFKSFETYMPQKIKTLSVSGGSSINTQMMGLQGTRILTATPGRLLDLVASNALKLTDISILCLDEADKLLNKGFEKELDQILSLLPPKRQNFLFSATLSPSIDSLSHRVLDQPQIIEIKESEEDLLSTIEQRAYSIEAEKKGPFLRDLIKKEKYEQVLVFTSSVTRADRVADKLRKHGIDAEAIHRNKKQGQRNNLLTKFRNKKLEVLVATDLLARGIDIEFLPVVINYELPRSPKDYIHRIGRTGRAENPGVAIALISQEEEHHFKVIQRKMKKKVPLEDPSL